MVAASVLLDVTAPQNWPGIIVVRLATAAAMFALDGMTLELGDRELINVAC